MVASKQLLQHLERQLAAARVVRHQLGEVLAHEAQHVGADIALDVMRIGDLQRQVELDGGECGDEAVAAHRQQPVDLEETRRLQHVADATAAERRVAPVQVVHHSGKAARAHPAQLDSRLRPLAHLVAEHRGEVGARGGQHGAVRTEHALAGAQTHVARRVVHLARDTLVVLVDVLDALIRQLEVNGNNINRLTFTLHVMNAQPDCVNNNYTSEGTL